MPPRLKTAELIKTACITVLGSGYLWPPGTWGSAVGALAFVVIWWLNGLAAGPQWTVDLIVVAGVLVSSVMSVIWGEWAIQRFGRADPRQFVLDEFAGQWVALLAVPLALAATPAALAAVVFGQFFFFRIADVIKPPPARQLEKLPAGWGILLDDLMAGVYANVAGQLLWRATPLASWLTQQTATA
ncbi:MAG: phosphatidylglycerophosphatase A [Phycisphaerae bacterium]|nr:phosphatidylglycerophosphatase A [Phycisphaerae bacterium]